MRKAAQATPLVIVKPMRFCTREGCDEPLAKSRKKYCSHRCRNLFFSTGGNGGGEPTSYRPEYATTKLKEYLEMIEEANKPTMVPTNSGFIVLNNARLPMIEDFALFLEVPTYSLKNWEKVHLDLAEALGVIMERQRMMIINQGFSGRYNPILSKLMLSANHGIVERKEIDHRHAMLGIVKHVYDQADALTEPTHDSNQPDGGTD